jgi:hypothetical protein
MRLPARQNSELVSKALGSAAAALGQGGTGRQRALALAVYAVLMRNLLRASLFTFGFSLLAATPESAVWKFDGVDRVGGYPAKVLGHPKVIETPAGKAVEFNGVDDALLLDVHPLAGAETFTWEVIFRPDLGGAREQRFFHLQETGTQTRLLFEIRTDGDRWFLDSFAMSGGVGKTLMSRGKYHPLGNWYAVQAVYDGQQFRNYVDGVLEGSADAKLPPQGPGRTSIGVRINLVDYFKGAILESRFTRRALPVSDFLRVPPALDTRKQVAR